jgi:hypothetical protein
VLNRPGRVSCDRETYIDVRLEDGDDEASSTGDVSAPGDTDIALHGDCRGRPRRPRCCGGGGQGAQGWRPARPALALNSGLVGAAGDVQRRAAGFAGPLAP